MATITEEITESLTELQAVCWQNSEDKGFHDSEPTEPAELAVYNGNRLMLIVSEVAEAHEEIRKGYPADMTYYPSDYLGSEPVDGPHKPEGVPSEIADIVIRCFDFAGSNGFDLGKVIQEKLTYNTSRAHMHGKKF